jgi:ubiquinone/menaquinone biosynthesis C-methylase UbiE
MAEYEMQSHWSGVGELIRERSDGNLLAGDDAPYYRYKGDQFAERFLPQIHPEGRAVLDVGCGAGANLRWMSERNPSHLVGCDQASEMVRLAKQNAPFAEVVQVDGETLPFSDGEFDLITTVTVLQHNPDLLRAKLLGEICRVSGDEILLFEDTSLQMPVAAAEGQGQYQNFFGRPVAWYAGVCNARGFDLVETQYLQTKVSLKTFLFLSGLLNRGRTGEGTPFSNLHLAIESRTIHVTSRLDRLSHARRGENTMMRFKRR